MNRNRFKKGLLLFTLSLLCSNIIFPQARTEAANGMVVSDNLIASETGLNILKEGGNAIDAAVATAFALAVTHPQAGNIGGGGFIVFMDSSGHATTIDFRETAPLKATRDMFVNVEGELRNESDPYGKKTTSNHAGIKSIGVPGTVAGLFFAQKKYGQLPWNIVIQPAILLAENGFPLTKTLAEHGKIFDEKAENTFLKNYFKNNSDHVLKEGEIWYQPSLAITLKKIRDKGDKGFYKGKIARRLTRYIRKNGGLITRKDLAKYQAIERNVVLGTFKGYDVLSMPPPSSGGIALIEMLNMFETATADSIRIPPFGSSAYYHLLTEIMRRAYADRAMYLGDPDFNPEIPVDMLLSKHYARERIANFNERKADRSDPALHNQYTEGDQTTHISVVDPYGNAVSLTYTLEYSYGSGMGSAELGFLLNNEMGDFNAVPGITNNNGQIGTAPNLIEPGKRMLSSMTPTIIAREGRPVIVIGSPGGRTIINTVFQSVIGMMEYKMDIQQAIESAKIHHQWLPDQIVYETGKIPPDILSDLEKMGHQLKARDELGRLMGIQIDYDKKIFIGVSDSSSPDGAPAGY